MSEASYIVMMMLLGTTYYKSLFYMNLNIINILKNLLLLKYIEMIVFCSYLQYVFAAYLGINPCIHGLLKNIHYYKII